MYHIYKIILKNKYKKKLIIISYIYKQFKKSWSKNVKDKD